VFCAVRETTERVFGARRLLAPNPLAAEVMDKRVPDDVLTAALDVVRSARRRASVCRRVPAGRRFEAGEASRRDPRGRRPALTARREPITTRHAAPTRE
jgi:hypothetical protein